MTCRASARASAIWIRKLRVMPVPWRHGHAVVERAGGERPGGRQSEGRAQDGQYHRLQDVSEGNREPAIAIRAQRADLVRPFQDRHRDHVEDAEEDDEQDDAADERELRIQPVHRMAVIDPVQLVEGHRLQMGKERSDGSGEDRPRLDLGERDRDGLNPIRRQQALRNVQRDTEGSAVELLRSRMEDSGDTQRDAPRRVLSSLHHQADLVFQVHSKTAGESLPEDDPVARSRKSPPSR